MSEPLLPDEIDVTNTKALEELAWAIEAAQGEFKLILARCNYINLRDRLVQQLQTLCPVPLQTLTLSETAQSLYATIRAELGEEQPAALMVFGLESVRDLDQVLTATNQVREEFRKHFHFPLVLWIHDDVLKKLVRLAPDFESWATVTEFAIAPNTLLQTLREETQQLFATLLDPKSNRSFQTRLESLSSLVILQPGELESAWQTLQQQGQALEPTLQASLEFCRGLNAEDKNAGLQYFQRSLTFWQQAADESGVDVATASLSDRALSDVPQFRVALLLFYIGQYRYVLAEQRQGEADWQIVREPLERCIEIFEQAQQQNLVAHCLIQLERVLQKLKAWDELEIFANKAIALRQSYSSQVRFSQNYGFIAQLALEQQQWEKAKQAALTALEITNQQPENRRWFQGLYLLFLAQAQRSLGKTAAALEALLQAKALGEQGFPRFYIRVLNELRNLYYSQKQYLESFQVKQLRLSIEQQYGIRAFVGAGRLQPKREEVAEEVGTRQYEQQVADTGEVAPEIIASGRRADLETLIQRIGRPDCKLIVVHGPSGVGKSSLVAAGLVPALQHRAIGIQENLPVLMRKYTDWIEVLGEELAQALEAIAHQRQLSASKLQTLTSEPQASSSRQQIPTPEVQASSAHLQTSSSKVEISSSKPQKSSSEVQVSSSTPQASSSELQSRALQVKQTSNYTLSAILERLRQNEQDNLRTILIFDQFEEFFFACTEPLQRRQFFEFLGECLHVLSLKVILSLREDYLHYLLECNRLDSMKIIEQDILGRKVLYSLGNFTPTAAKAIIRDLTERAQFYLEPALVDKVVADLAGELEEVRPIELQIVGAQLQTEAITTLAQYCQRGPKQELVKRYLSEVVEDCGPENHDMAELVLYLLTDEKGTRPLKTRAELERDLQALASDAKGGAKKLDLVLQIFVESGLVVLLKESPADRYQLVHDYLAAFIRQQQEPKLQALMAELEAERQQRKLGEAKLNSFLKRALIGSVTAGVVLTSLTGLAGIAIYSARQAERQRQRAERSEIVTLNAWSDVLLISDQPFDALLRGLKAASQLDQTNWATSDHQIGTAATLQQAIYAVQERNRLEDHNGSVHSTSFSPDGKTIASASADNTIKLWSLKGQLITTLKGHSDWVNSVSFSPDGKTIASASADNTIKLWSLKGQLITSFEGHNGSVHSISFSPDGKTIASASADNTIKLWSLKGQLITSFEGHNGSVHSISFSPDGKTIASVSADNTIKLWNLQGKETQSTQAFSHNGSVHSISFSPDGKTIASASADNTIKLWSLKGQLITSFEGHKNAINSVSFSPDGKTIASASADNTIKLWSLKGQLITTLKGHSDWVNSASFSPDGKTIASASADNTIKLWSLKGQLVTSFEGHSDWVNSVSFSPDGKTIASASADKTIKLWSLKGQLITTLKGRHNAVSSASFSPDGKTIASASIDHIIKLWNLQGQLLATLRIHNDAVNSVSFSPDGKTIASASADKTIKLWRLKGQELKTLKGHNGSVNSVSFSPDGKTIASASADKTIKLWNLQGQELKTLKGHNGSVNSVSFGPDGKTIASASADKTIKLWNLQGQLLATLEGHNGSVNSVSFSPDGKTIASASADKTIKLWNLQGQLLATLKDHSDWVNSVSFSPDGKTIASASADKTIKVRPLDFRNLVNRSCVWLENYLATHPESLTELKSCQTPVLLQITAAALVTQGEELARTGNIADAVAKFQQALSWDANLRLQPQQKAKDLAQSQQLLTQGEELAQQENLQATTAKFKEAVKLDPSLEINPETQAKQLVAATLAQKAQDLAQQENLQGALTKFKEAVKLDPDLEINPETNVEQLVISSLSQKAQDFIEQKKYKEAIATYTRAQKLDPDAISANSFNELCWQGSLNGAAQAVLHTCEQAVSLAPDDAMIRDSRGVARALTGNTQGAIADFQAFINWTDNKEEKVQRQSWVTALQAGKNPFTPEELKKLRGE